MKEMEAYGNRYTQRVAIWYKPGDRVTLGPAYRGNGEYAPDGFSGPYTVVAIMDAAGDYKVCRGDVVDVEEMVHDWDVIINASRLTRR